MNTLFSAEAILIDKENVLTEIKKLLRQRQAGIKPAKPKVRLCYDPSHYDFNEELLQGIGSCYWQIISFWRLPTVQEYIKTLEENEYVNIPISICHNELQVAQHRDKRISTCVHYLSYRQDSVYWYKPKYNVQVLLPAELGDLPVMLKTKGGYISDILADGLNLLLWEEEMFTQSILRAFANI